MSLVYLASSLEKWGHKVAIYDASLGSIVKAGTVFRYGVSDEDMLSFLSKTKYDLIGITCSFNARFRYVENIARQCKKIFPKNPVALGGLFPTSQWRHCLGHSGDIDFIVLGEAELSFSQIVNNIAEGQSINESCKGVDGVAWRNEGKIFCNPKSEYNDKLDDLPFPAWHLMDLKKYFVLQKKIFELPAPCLPILSSRSCPNRCRFCNMYITHGSKWRARSAQNLLNELEFLKGRFNVSNFYFIDDNFSLNPQRAKAICQGIIERKLNVKYNFHNGLSIKTIDRELVLLMKESGCTSACLAVESGSERIRNIVYGKNLMTEKIFEVFSWFKEAGIPTIGYFLVGAPGEKRQDFEETKKLLAKLPMSLLTVGIFTPYPGTELYDECKKNGWLLEDSLDNKDRVELFSAALSTPDFGPKEVQGWKKELYFSFISHHWASLIKEMFHPYSVVNIDAIGKFIGMLKFKPFAS